MFSAKFAIAALKTSQRNVNLHILKFKLYFVVIWIVIILLQTINPHFSCANIEFQIKDSIAKEMKRILHPSMKY